MLPLMAIVARLLDKPLRCLGKKLGINSVATLALFGSLVTNASTFGVMEKMDKKGVMLIPENEDYSPIPLSPEDFESGEARILGIATEIKIKL